MTFSTPIRGKIDSSKTTDSGFGEVKSLKQPSHEQFVSTPPSSSCGVEISPIEKKRSNKYTCKQCDYQAPSLTALKAHLREHDLPCKCPICHKGFTRQWLLEGHIRTHNGEKVSISFRFTFISNQSTVHQVRLYTTNPIRSTCPLEVTIIVVTSFEHLQE